MIRQSTNLSPLYVERWPDWQKGVALEIVTQTKITTARSGLEQRTRLRARPIYRLSYYESGLEAGTLRARQKRALAEMQSPLWVPFWSERCRLTHAATTTTVRIDRDPSADWFAPGHKLALWNGSELEFRLILSVTGRTITTDVGTMTPDTGAKVYPVRLCRRLPGNDGHTMGATQSGAEQLSFETL